MTIADVSLGFLGGALALIVVGCRSEPTRSGSPGAPATTKAPGASPASAGSTSGARPLAPPPTAPSIPVRDIVVIAASTLRVSRTSFPGTSLPEQSVQVPAFAIDRYEVPVREYRACVDAGRCTVPQMHVASCNFDAPGRERHPVNCVVRPQAAQFCAWISARLPSEDEWDAAAVWAAAKEHWLGEGACLEQAETCAVEETGSQVLPGWSDNVAEWTTSPFCQTSHPLCSETVVKGRAFHDTGSFGAHERRLPPIPDSTNDARRRPEEVGFRCVR